MELMMNEALGLSYGIYRSKVLGQIFIYDLLHLCIACVLLCLINS